MKRVIVYSKCRNGCEFGVGDERTKKTFKNPTLYSIQSNGHNAFSFIFRPVPADITL